MNRFGDALADADGQQEQRGGISTLSGLKYITIRRTCRLQRQASVTNRNFELPARLAYSIGT
jgi:hypothetical protein